MPDFKLGIAAKAAELGADVVGAPLSVEEYITPDLSVQMAEKGIFVYSKQANTVHFIQGQ